MRLVLNCFNVAAPITDLSPDHIPKPHMTEEFEILGRIEFIETIAVGNRIREIGRLRRTYGHGRWRKLKGLAIVSFLDGTIELAEIHWYEAHGIGRKELKITDLLD